MIEFGGWGHDAWGATVTEIRVVDVAQCRHCGEPHPTTRVTRDAGGKATGAWCTDGIHPSWRPEDG